MYNVPVKDPSIPLSVSQSINQSIRFAVTAWFAFSTDATRTTEELAVSQGRVDDT